MDFGVIRNKKQALELTERIKEMRLPFKYFFQPIYPGRSIDVNNYYWGIVLAMISDVTGHTIEELHEEYKKKYLYKGEFEFNTLTKQYEWKVGVGSSAALDEKEFWDYVMKIRVEAEIELHICIPLPSECFIPELDYEHDKIKTKRL